MLPCDRFLGSSVHAVMLFDKAEGEELIGCHPEHLAAPWLSVHGGSAPLSLSVCPVARPAPPPAVVFSPASDPP